MIIMARKEYRYRGYTGEQLQQLPLKEFIQLLPSRERRTLMRGFTPEEQSLLNKLEKRDKVKTHERQMIILPSMIGKIIKVHTGKEFIDITIIPEMVGLRLGQFALSRKRTAHSSAGVGAAKKQDRK